MKNSKLIHSLKGAVKNRKAVLEDLGKFGIEESNRPQLEKNLKHFEDRLKEVI